MAHRCDAVKESKFINIANTPFCLGVAFTQEDILWALKEICNKLAIPTILPFHLLPHNIIILCKIDSAPVGLASLHIKSGLGLPMLEQLDKGLETIYESLQNAQKPAQIECITYKEGVQDCHNLLFCSSVAMLESLGVDLIAMPTHSFPPDLTVSLNSIKVIDQCGWSLLPKAIFSHITDTFCNNECIVGLKRTMLGLKTIELKNRTFLKVILSPSLFSYLIDKFEHRPKDLTIDQLREIMYYYPSWDFTQIIPTQILKTLSTLYPLIHKQVNSEQIYQ